MDGASSSVMVTDRSRSASRRLRPAGRLAPKLSLTLSSSSSTSSCASASKVKVLEVSPLVKVTLPGTPE